jgi:hypothetical protein
MSVTNFGIQVKNATDSTDSKDFLKLFISVKSVESVAFYIFIGGAATGNARV